MIDEARTLELFGYTSDELSKGSHKKVVAVCDDCGIVRHTMVKQYRDLCHLCSVRTPGRRAHQSKINNARLPITEETRRKQSNSHIGSHASVETRRKQSESHRAEKNHNWKGGLSSWRAALWHSQPYRAWRGAVFRRDGYACQVCGDSSGGNLQAHHIHPVRDNKNTLLIFDINNGITLCKECHEVVNGNEYAFIEEFEIMVADRKVYIG